MMIVGVDEAGRGPLAGPLVSCALYLKKALSSWGRGVKKEIIRDSKQLSPAQREEAFAWLSEYALFSVGIATHKEIDRHNVSGATFLAFNRAIKGIVKKAPYLRKATFIIDGTVFRTDLKLTYRCMAGADRTVQEVSCASIVAKVTRDYLMNISHFLFPHWNFSKHKGYPTKEHTSLLEKHILSPLHRRSFSPCCNEHE